MSTIRQKLALCFGRGYTKCGKRGPMSAGAAKATRYTGYIETTSHSDERFRPLTFQHKWTGDDYVRITEDLLAHAYCSQVETPYLPMQSGDRFRFGPYRLRVYGYEEYEPDGRVYLAVRERNFTANLHVLWHHLSRWPDAVYRRIINTLAIWGLADYDNADIPCWRDVHILRRLFSKAGTK